MPRLIAVAAGCLAVLVVAPALAQTPAQDVPVITATGEASIVVAPDCAYVSMAAETRAGKPAAAQQKAADAMTALQTALTGLGLPASAIKTTSYSLQPEMDYSGGGASVRDYVARNQIEVRVDKLDMLSSVIDAGGPSGATSMTGLRFDLKDRSAVEHQALERAVQDALTRASAMAAGAGRQAGSIVRIQEQRMSPPVARPMAMTAMAAGRGGAAPTPIDSGEIEIHAQVTLTVSIR